VQLVLGKKVATPEWFKAHTHWFPESDRLRPKGLSKADWERLCLELQWGGRPQTRQPARAVLDAARSRLSRPMEAVKWLLGIGSKS